MELSDNQRNKIFELLDDYTPTQVKIILLLTNNGGMSIRNISEELYGDCSECSLDAVRIHIHHLKKRGGNIEAIRSNGKTHHTRFNRYVYHLMEDNEFR